MPAGPADPAEPVVREIDIDAAPATVFEFFVDAGKLTRWLALEATLDPRPGGVCHQIHDGADRGRERCLMQGTFVEVDPPRRVVFTWGFDEPGIDVPPGSSTVEVSLTAAGAGTRVRLEHRGLPAHEIEAHASGWTEMLSRLARAVTNPFDPKEHE